MLILADDRTGALETAGALAEAVGQPMLVSVHRPGGETTVVDIGTRHLAPWDAAARVSALAGRVVALKTDSLLRGNWAAEIGSLAAAGRRVVFVPASPAAGRTCVGGVVRADGVPVDELPDARAAATTSRPGLLLGADELSPSTLHDWLAGERRVAVCDAATADDLASVAAALARHPDVIPAGPAAAVVQALAARDSATRTRGPATRDQSRDRATRTRDPATRTPSRDRLGRDRRAPMDAFRAQGAPGRGRGGGGGGVVAVVGSVHPMALAQADRLATTDATVFRSDLGAGPTPDEVVADLAIRSAPYLADASLLILVGGDTTSAILGDHPAIVHRLVGPGTALLTTEAYPGVTVVTKPGSFGDPDTLVELAAGRMGP